CRVSLLGSKNYILTILADPVRVPFALVVLMIHVPCGTRVISRLITCRPLEPAVYTFCNTGVVPSTLHTCTYTFSAATAFTCNCRDEPVTGLGYAISGCISTAAFTVP